MMFKTSAYVEEIPQYQITDQPLRPRDTDKQAREQTNIDK